MEVILLPISPHQLGLALPLITFLVHFPGSGRGTGEDSGREDPGSGDGSVAGGGAEFSKRTLTHTQLPNSAEKLNLKGVSHEN
jgi:hypothetical protein